MSGEMIRVLVVEPMEEPRLTEIPNDLSAMQQLVGGYIQAVYPYEDSVALVCNEEGKLMCLPSNRMLRDSAGDPYDVICGTFFVAGLGEEDFCSLTDEQASRYRELFSGEMLFDRGSQQETWFDHSWDENQRCSPEEFER